MSKLRERGDEMNIEFYKSKSLIDDNGCWIWSGSRDRGGYGRINVGNVVQYVHRLTWALVNGDIPNGLSSCHTCDRPPCCNPSHLFLGTQKDNNLSLIHI